jgi:uncharacterized protein YlxW (UPF0749 family)
MGEDNVNKNMLIIATVVMGAACLVSAFGGAAYQRHHDTTATNTNPTSGPEEEKMDPCDELKDNIETGQAKLDKLQTEIDELENPGMGMRPNRRLAANNRQLLASWRQQEVEMKRAYNEKCR